MGYYSVDILTPSRVVARDMSADSLLIPTVRGQINVLPQHTHVIEKLDNGILSIFDYEMEEYFNITTGICKIFEKKINILVPVVENCFDIDKERAIAALKVATDKLEDTSALTDDEVEKYRRKFERAQFRIELADNAKKLLADKDKITGVTGH